MNNTDNRDKLNTVHEAGIDEAAVSDGAAVQGLGFSDTEIKGAVEALLFVTDEPVNILTLADAIQIDPRKVEEALVSLRDELLHANRGIQLREVAGGWRLVTHPVYHELIERYVTSWDTRKLSQAALETLAIVAYCQPVTRNEISSIRGVSSDSSVNSLLEKGLLREAGVQDSPGNPALYGTSKAFLEKFGLKNVSELPPLEGFAPDDETKALIAERLRVVRITEDEVPMPSEGATASLASSAHGVSFEEGSEESERLAQNTMHAMFNDALASTAGVVDKINFDELVFEED